MGVRKTDPWFGRGLMDLDKKSLLHAYYLQQMGIDPWILRDKKPLLQGMVIGEALEGRSLVLLYAMLKSIGLLPHELLIGGFDLLDSAGARKPLAILSLGACAGYSRGLEQDIHGIPMIVTHPVAHVLEHPIDKREVLNDLHVFLSCLRSRRV